MNYERIYFTVFAEPNARADQMRGQLELYGKALLIALPLGADRLLVANVGLILFDIGVCDRFGIPLFVLSVTPEVLTVSVASVLFWTLWLAFWSLALLILIALCAFVELAIRLLAKRFSVGTDGVALVWMTQNRLPAGSARTT